LTHFTAGMTAEVDRRGRLWEAPSATHEPTVESSVGGASISAGQAAQRGRFQMNCANQSIAGDR